MKAKINGAGIELQSFCTARKPLTKWKDKHWMGESIFKDMNNKGLVLSKIYEELIQFNSKRTTHQNEQIEWLAQRNGKQMANGHMRKCLTLWIIRGMQLNPQVVYLCLSKWLISKYSTNSKYRWGCWEKGTLVHGWWWECKLVWVTVENNTEFIKKLEIWPRDST